jgi:hypothetical protein
MTSFTANDDGSYAIIKDPQARLDYKFDWTDWLGADTIASATFDVEAGSGIVKDTQSNDTSSATVWLSGGTVGMSATVTCHIVTAVGRQDDRSFTVFVQQR